MGELTVECNPYFPTVVRLELLSVHFYRTPVRNKNIVSHNPRLRRTIPDWILSVIARPPRRKETRTVSQDGTAPGLVEGDPVLALVAEGGEDGARVVREVGDELGFVEEAAVSVVEGGGEVPVEERYHGDDAGGV